MPGVWLSVIGVILAAILFSAGIVAGNALLILLGAALLTISAIVGSKGSTPSAAPGHEHGETATREHH